MHLRHSLSMLAMCGIVVLLVACGDSRPPTEYATKPEQPTITTSDGRVFKVYGVADTQFYFPDHVRVGYTGNRFRKTLYWNAGQLHIRWTGDGTTDIKLDVLVYPVNPDAAEDRIIKMYERRISNSALADVSHDEALGLRVHRDQRGTSRYMVNEAYSGAYQEVIAITCAPRITPTDTAGENCRSVIRFSSDIEITLRFPDILVPEWKRLVAEAIRLLTEHAKHPDIEE